eukprot:4553398-Pleurochrysis_carterae.AAC.1
MVLYQQLHVVYHSCQLLSAGSARPVKYFGCKPVSFGAVHSLQLSAATSLRSKSKHLRPRSKHSPRSAHTDAHNGMRTHHSPTFCPVPARLTTGSSHSLMHPSLDALAKCPVALAARQLRGARWPPRRRSEPSSEMAADPLI